jgi:hypothetical protein
MLKGVLRRAPDALEAAPPITSRTRASPACAGFENDLTGVPARQQRRQCLAGRGQRKNFRDQRLEPAGLPPAQQLGAARQAIFPVTNQLLRGMSAQDRNVTRRAK